VYVYNVVGLHVDLCVCCRRERLRILRLW